MADFGFKKIFNLETRAAREEALTATELTQFEKAQKEFEKEAEKESKLKYLRDRLNDPDWPTVEEKIDAIWQYLDGNLKPKSDIDARVSQIIKKYPAP